MSNFVFVALVGLGCLSRLIPHVDQFTLIFASVLILNLYFSRIQVAVGAFMMLFLSDVALASVFGEWGYPGQLWNYFSFVALAGLRLNPQRAGVLRLWVGYPALACLSFFATSNFGVWLFSGLYSKTVGGLLECYLLAIPFFWPTVASTLVSFPILELVARRVRADLPRGLEIA